MFDAPPRLLSHHHRHPDPVADRGPCATRPGKGRIDRSRDRHGRDSIAARQRQRPGTPRCSRPWLRLALTGLLALVGAGTAAEPCEPMKMAGKTTLYLQVLTRPGARVCVNPGAPPDGEPLDTFTRFYVYEREDAAGAPWVRVGTDIGCRQIVGWLPGRMTLDWEQEVTLALTNPANRERLLFFRSRADLQSVYDADDPAAVIRALADKADCGENDPRIEAVEPKAHVDFKENFYLLPILGYEDFATRRAGNNIGALRVALVGGPGSESPAASTGQLQRHVPDERAAIIFVVDSTISMKPYIDETKAAVLRFYERIKRANLLDQAGIGLSVMHLQTREAIQAGNIARAEEQYRVLAKNALDQAVAYFPIPRGSAEQFRQAIDACANQVIDDMGNTERTPERAATAPAAPPDAGGQQQARSAEDAGDVARQLGLAMRLARLGKTTTAPEVFEAWIPDRDAINPGVTTVKPHVLLSKNQLSDLFEIVDGVLDIARGGFTEDRGKAAELYDQLRSVSIWFTRPGSEDVERDATAIGEKGLLLELIKALPYQSDVVALNLDDWTSWGLQRQNEFVLRLEGKLLNYERYSGDRRGVVRLSKSVRGSRDKVYPVPLSDMP